MRFVHAVNARKYSMHMDGFGLESVLTSPLLACFTTSWCCALSAISAGEIFSELGRIRTATRTLRTSRRTCSTGTSFRNHVTCLRQAFQLYGCMCLSIM